MKKFTSTILILWSGLIYAQRGVYTVEPPPGYRIESVEDFANVIVEAAPFTSGYQLGFDTLNAIGIGEQIAESVSFEPTVSDDLLIDRLSCIQNEIPLTFHPQVRAFVDYFTGPKRDFTLRALAKKDIYFPLFEKIFEEYGIPPEMKYLSIIESALDPFALSPAKAMGLWQFIPQTGKIYGLRQNNYIDERCDPEKSTRAAARYLKQLYHFFDNDWELAISAYNCGPGNVKRAMRKAGSSEFWDIYEYLPRETRSYLPSFVAIMYVFNYAEEHNLVNDKIQYPIEFEEVYINQFVDLKRLASALKVCFEDLKELNPELKADIIPSTAYNYPLRIPVARYDYFLAHREAILDSASNPHAKVYLSIKRPTPGIHIVQKGESVVSIARQYGISPDNIRQWNMLLTDKLHAGQKVIVSADKAPKKLPVKGSPVATAAPQPKTEPEAQVVESLPATEETGESSKSETENSVKPTSSAPRALIHTVRRGESLGRIAARYSVTVKQIVEHNQLRGDKITAGQKLKIPSRVYASHTDKTPVTNPPKTQEFKEEAPARKQKDSPKYYIIRSGDSLWEIANRHNTTVEKIKRLNTLSTSKLKPGQKIRVK